MTAIDIVVSVACEGWEDALPDAEGVARRAAAVALAGAAVPHGVTEVSVVLADDALVRELNRVYRGKNKPTNVLSFPALDDGGDGPHMPGQPVPLGDVIVALETSRDEALSHNKPLGEHLSHLVIHGILHLTGLDHEDEADAAEMEGLETRLLASMGIADPYYSEDAPNGKDRAPPPATDDGYERQS